MQSKIIGGALGLVWGALCYQGGRVYGNQKIEQVKTPVQETKQSVLESAAPMVFLRTQNEVTNRPLQTLKQGPVTFPIRVINYPHFKIIYSTYFKTPLAVHQTVTKELADGKAKRSNKFYEEPLIQPEFRATDKHFTQSGASKNFNFSRGHMAGAANYNGDQKSKDQTFTFANMVPQNQSNNSGIWSTFEEYSRNLVLQNKCENVEIISGPLYYKNNPYSNGGAEPLVNVYQEQSIVLLPNGMMAPQKLYKIIKCNSRNESYIGAFEFWNAKTDDNSKKLKDFQTSLQSISEQTGLKFDFQAFNTLVLMRGATAKPTPTLFEYDIDGLNKTKRDYDEPYFRKLMLNATSLYEFSSAWKNAHRQNIDLPLKDFKEQSQNLFKKDLEEIRGTYIKNPLKSACHTLSELIKVNKGLYYLKELTPQREKHIKDLESSGPLDQCLNKVSELRSVSFDDLISNDQRSDNLRDEKTALNSVLWAISRTLEESKQKAAVDQSRDILSYINQQKLKKFLIAGQHVSTYAEEPFEE